MKIIIKQKVLAWLRRSYKCKKTKKQKEDHNKKIKCQSGKRKIPAFT